MSKPSNRIVRTLQSLVLLGALLGALVACGGPTPTPQIVVVTSTFTTEPEVVVVTATFTPTPEVPPTDMPPPPTPTSPPTATPEEVALEFFAYEHPSGAFSLDLPQGSEYSDDEEGVFFAYADSLVMALFTVPDTPPDAAALEATVPAILDEALVGEGLITSYDDLEVQVSEEGDAVAASFTMTSDTLDDGEGGIIMWQVGSTLYMMILLTPDYDAVEAVWQRALDSLAFSPVEPTAAPEPPTHTPAPPKPTPKPKPTATPQPPPPSANQGCYLIENHLGADLTITFTARDRDWSDSFQIPANGTKEYCLDPGRYTYTLDAPPPWGSTNGELEVKAGDRYRWPIRGE